MKINGNAVRVGMVIELDNRLWKATKIQHTQPGKGGAYLQVELKDIQVGTKRNERFRSAETVERVNLEQMTYQFLFKDADMFVFMNTETFEQISLNSDDVGENAVPYLSEGLQVIIDMYDGKPLGLQLPEKMVFEIADTESVIKGQTASSSFKPAVLSNGLRTSVPPHIGVGDKVIINTEDCSYVERVK